MDAGTVCATMSPVLKVACTMWVAAGHLVWFNL